MNKKRIRELRDFIKKLPDRAVSMPSYINCDRPEETVSQAMKHSCGTQACIAGWAALKFYPKRRARIDNMRETINGEPIPSIAQEVLDLKPAEARDLFMGYWSTVPEYMGRYFLTKAHVIAELNYMLKTGKV